jgi:hypothetical protein
MPMTRGRESARLALHNAEASLHKGDERAAEAWLLAALDESAEWLGHLDPGYRLWPQWRRFRGACRGSAVTSFPRLVWAGALRRSVVSAERAFEELEAVVADRSERPGLGAPLAVALEDLLDQVWRSEREWDFDNRIWRG